MEQLNGDIEKRDNTIADLNDEVQQRNQVIDRLSREIVDLADELSKQRVEAGRLNGEIRNAQAAAAEVQKNLGTVLESREAMLHSLSWRSTAFIRHISRALGKARAGE